MKPPPCWDVSCVRLRGEMLLLRELRSKGTWYANVFPLQIWRRSPLRGGSAREITPWAAAEQELRHTVLGALKAQEFERNMVSKFLHDSVGQNLTALGLQLDLIRMDLESVSPRSCVRIGGIQKLLEEMMESSPGVQLQAEPVHGGAGRLAPALDRLAVRMRERFTGTLRLNVDPSLKLDKQIAVPLYQIAQEAVENAVQHSSCSVIEIAVKSTRAGTPLGSPR